MWASRSPMQLREYIYIHYKEEKGIRGRRTSLHRFSPSFIYSPFITRELMRIAIFISLYWIHFLRLFQVLLKFINLFVGRLRYNMWTNKCKKKVLKYNGGTTIVEHPPSSLDQVTLLFSFKDGIPEKHYKTLRISVRGGYQNLERRSRKKTTSRHKCYQLKFGQEIITLIINYS